MDEIVDTEDRRINARKEVEGAFRNVEEKLSTFVETLDKDDQKEWLRLKRELREYLVGLNKEMKIYTEEVDVEEDEVDWDDIDGEF